MSPETLDQLAEDLEFEVLEILEAMFPPDQMDQRAASRIASFMKKRFRDALEDHFWYRALHGQGGVRET